MKDQANKWVEEVLESMNQSKRAIPDAGLLAKIEGQLYGKEAKLITLRQLRMAAAAAVLLLLLNAFVINEKRKANSIASEQWIEMETAETQILSDFTVYD